MNDLELRCWWKTGQKQAEKWRGRAPGRFEEKRKWFAWNFLLPTKQ
jgi:hypothetical protein